MDVPASVPVPDGPFRSGSHLDVPAAPKKACIAIPALPSCQQLLDEDFVPLEIFIANATEAEHEFLVFNAIMDLSIDWADKITSGIARETFQAGLMHRLIANMAGLTAPEDPTVAELAKRCASLVIAGERIGRDHKHVAGAMRHAQDELLDMHRQQSMYDLYIGPVRGTCRPPKVRIKLLKKMRLDLHAGLFLRSSMTSRQTGE